jgi:hypothetical protein
MHRKMSGYDRGLHIATLTTVPRAEFERLRLELHVEMQERSIRWEQVPRSDGDAVVYYGLDFFEA